MSTGKRLTTGSVPATRREADAAHGPAASAGGPAASAHGPAASAGGAVRGLASGPAATAVRGLAGDAARKVVAGAQRGPAGAAVRKLNSEQVLERRSALARAMAVRFRLHGRHDPAPGTRRLAVVATWAGALGLGGAIIALRLMITLFVPTGGWYAPTVIVIGCVGLVATMGAFASIHRYRLPWIMLSLGTAALVAAFVATASA